MLPLPLHPELGGEEGHYQTVWRRSTNVNEFGMALFVPKPDPISARTAPRTRVPMVPAAL